MTTGVLCAVRGPAETEVVRGIDADAALSVTRRCADLAELLAAGAAGLGRVAVLTADLPGVDSAAVAHLQRSQVWVVALADAGSGWSAERLHRLGVDAVVPVEQAGSAVAAVVLGLVAAGQGATHPGGSADGSLPAHAGDLAPAPPPAARRPDGAVVVVWGPAGAPGRSTVAIGLAAELADRGGAILVDADTYGGTLAPMLGLLDEAPGLVAACRAAGTGMLTGGLDPFTTGVAPGLRALTGIARAQRWPELPRAALDVVWRAARAQSPWTVVDVGFCLEQDELLSYDTRAPGRNGATLSALAAADLVVVVGTGDPIGLQRLVRGLDELGEVQAGVELVVVVNRVRASASGPRPEQAIRQAMARYAGVTEVHLLPHDPVCDAAVLAARTVREHAPAGALRQGLVALADEVVRTARVTPRNG